MGSAGPSWSSGVVPRKAENGCASSIVEAKPATRATTMTRSRAFIESSSCPFNADRAFLEVRLQRDRIGRVECHFVDQLALVEPRHEHDAARHAVAPPRFEPRADEPAARLHLHLITAPHL